MSNHAGESADQDPLLEFANEPETTPAVEPASVEPVQAAATAEVAPPVPSDPSPAAAPDALQARIDQLEQTIEKSIGQIALLTAEVATLVGVVGDIRKREIRRAAPERLPSGPIARTRSRTVTAVFGVLVGMAIGILGWMSWSRDSVEATRLEPAPVAVETPAEPESQPETAIALASTAPPAQDIPARAITESSAQATAYVGTLSVDAEPGGQVFIDREPVGSAPVRVENLKAGSHLVWIERDGYRRWTRVVEVRSDRVSRVSAVLEPLNPR